MRLIGSLLALGASLQIASCQQRILFDTSGFLGTGVLSVASSTSPLTSISFRREGTNVDILEVLLLQGSTTQARRLGQFTAGNSAPPTTSSSPSLPVELNVTLSTTQGQILMNHQAFLNDESLQGQTNFFQVKYMLVGSSGARQSFSPRFIVYDSASASTGLAQPPSPGVVVEEEGEFRDIQQPLGSAKPPNDASPGDSRPTDTMPDSPIGSTGLTAGPSEGRVGGRGMPTGAIVGIAVGCSVIGLVVIGLLSWWFCLRRKRSPGPAMSELPGSEPHAVAGGHHRHHDALLAHKEVSTSAGMVETPDSPYLDERMHGHLGNGAAASTTLPSGISSHGMAPQQHSPYSPYADVAAPTAAASGSPHGSAAVPAASNMSGYQTDDSSHQRQPAAAAGSGTTAPLPISERYRHLAEEGMTPEQLAQLEAEERALDAAIAEAARR